MTRQQHRTRDGIEGQSRHALERVRGGMRRLLLPAPLIAAAGLVVVLTWQAWLTARSHRATVDNALHEYATFAAWQYARRASDHLRLVLWYTFQRIDASTLRQLPETESWSGSRPCLQEGGCGAQLIARSIALVDGRSATLLATDGRWAPGEAERAARIVTSQLARVPNSVFGAGLAHDSAGGATRMLAYSVQHHPDRPARIVMMAITPRSLTAVLGHAAEYAPLLPVSLTRRTRNADILASALTVRGAPLVTSGDLRRGTTRGRDTLGIALGSIETVVGVYPEAAAQLIVGGVPKSRVPMLLAVLTVTLALVSIAVVQMRRAEELARLRADFVAGISHELRTPLTQISLFSDTLLAGRERTADERRHFLLIISREAKRLRQLVESVLHFATQGRRDGPLALEDTVVAAEVEAAVEAFAPIAEAKGIRLETSLDESVVSSLNRDAFRQMLLNILDNAVKFGPANTPVLVTLAAARGFAVLSITDRGVGIPARAVEMIFEPFVRAHIDGAPAAAGSGIGLAVVREIAVQHGGRVRAENAAHGGARIIVELPLALPVPAPLVPAAR